MAGRDGTGPMGQGAMSGRGLGLCNGVNSGAYSTGSGREIGRQSGMGFGVWRGIGRRAGMGFGAGNGCRRGFGYGLARESAELYDKEILKEEKELLQNRLDMLNKQLEGIV